MSGDTASIQYFTYWILAEANIQKHCVANMSRTGYYKTEKTNVNVTFRDLGTKKKINAWFLRNRGITYFSCFGHSVDSHFIRGKRPVLNIAQEMNTMLGSIWKCMKWHLGTEAMHDQQIGAYKDERVQAIRSNATNWPIVQLIFDEQLADARITIYVPDEFEGFSFNDAKDKFETWFPQEEEYQKRNRGERPSQEESSSSSSYIPRPPNQLVEVESPQRRWRRRIFPWSSLEEEFPNFIMEFQSNITALQNKGDKKGQGKGETKGKGNPPPRGTPPKATSTEPPKGKGKTQPEENPENPKPQPQPYQQPPATRPNRTLDFRIRDEMKGTGQGQGKGKGKGKTKGKQSILSRPQDWWLPAASHWPMNQWQTNDWRGNEWQENEWQEYW